jgi:hypothetical protein
MAIVFAVTDLMDKVVARFATLGMNTPQFFGWREPTKQHPLPCIVWVPGDDESGDMGAVVGARYPGKLTERPVLNLDELVTVYIESVDTTAPENERAQYESVRALFDAWVSAIHYVAHGTFKFDSDPAWLIEKKERRYGAAIRVVLTVQAVIPDAAVATAPVDTGASVTPALEYPGDPPVDIVDDNVPDVIAPGGD